jgi:dUTP pyrophosphatase
MNTIQLKVTNNRLFDYGLPERTSQQGAGYGLRAVLDDPVILYAEETAAIPTGVALSLFDDNMAAFICPLTELAQNEGIVLQNGASPVSTDNQKEIRIGLRNEGQELRRINPGDVIAQLVFVPIAHPLMSVVSEFEAPSPEIEELGPAELTDLGLGHSPGTQDKPMRVFPAELVGNDREGEDPIYTEPDGATQNQVLNPPDGLDEVLEGHE